MSNLLRLKQIKIVLLVTLAPALTTVFAVENWEQFKYDCRHSGNVPDRTVTVPLGLVGAVPLTDSVLTAPVVSEGRIYVIDASGVAFGIDAKTLKVLWQTPTGGGKANCNNVSSPAISGRYLHFGTMAGSYYVLDATTGTVVKEIRCGEPIFSTPVINPMREQNKFSHGVNNGRSAPVSMPSNPTGPFAGRGTSSKRFPVLRETAGAAKSGPSTRTAA